MKEAGRAGSLALFNSIPCSIVASSCVYCAWWKCAESPFISLLKLYLESCGNITKHFCVDNRYIFDIQQSERYQFIERDWNQYRLFIVCFFWNAEKIENGSPLLGFLL